MLIFPYDQPKVKLDINQLISSVIESQDSIEPNPVKLEKILESSRPETKTQIKSFLGLIGYYQQFLPNYSKITTPLTDLLKKSLPTKINWGTDQERAFQVLKSFILNSPILKLPNLDQPFVLRYDASDYAIAGVLFAGTRKFIASNCVLL